MSILLRDTTSALSSKGSLLRLDQSEGASEDTFRGFFSDATASVVCPTLFRFTKTYFRHRHSREQSQLSKCFEHSFLGSLWFDSWIISFLNFYFHSAAVAFHSCFHNTSQAEIHAKVSSRVRRACMTSIVIFTFSSTNWTPKAKTQKYAIRSVFTSLDFVIMVKVFRTKTEIRGPAGPARWSFHFLVCDASYILERASIRRQILVNSVWRRRAAAAPTHPTGPVPDKSTDRWSWASTPDWLFQVVQVVFAGYLRYKIRHSAIIHAQSRRIVIRIDLNVFSSSLSLAPLSTEKNKNAMASDLSPARKIQSEDPYGCKR